MAFGRYGHFPFRFGGGESDHRAVHMAMLDALAPGWDVSEGTEVWCETYAHAQAISLMWSVNRRLANQAIPMRMSEALPEWEVATIARPAFGDSAVTRRRRIAAKLRGIAGNTLADIYETCQAFMGDNFEDVITVPIADVVSYHPGGPPLYDTDGNPLCSAPGPPGFETSSNRTRIGIRLNKNAIGDNEWLDRRARLAEALDAMLPAWCRFTIGTGSGFTLGVSVLGEAFFD